MHDVENIVGEVRRGAAGAVAGGAAPLQRGAGHEARPPAAGRANGAGYPPKGEERGAPCPKCGGPAAATAPLLTAEDVLELEVGASERRVLRELLRAGEKGLTAREVLTAIYIKWPDWERRVVRGMRQSYVKKLMRDLRTALRDVEVRIVPIEYAARRPVRWAITTAAEPEVPRVPLPHVVAEPKLAAAIEAVTRMQGAILRHLAAAGERGMSSGELIDAMYPAAVERPGDPGNSISALISDARVVIHRYDLAVVTRPAAGPNARRYLVRTR